jgi:hypothetical protein
MASDNVIENRSLQFNKGKDARQFNNKIQGGTSWDSQLTQTLMHYQLIMH